MMVGPLILLAASVAPVSQNAPAAGQAIGTFRATSAVTARAKASVRVLSGARFGAGQTGQLAGSIRRKVELSDSQGSTQQAELLEFQ